jgi:hypothetical protein
MKSDFIPRTYGELDAWEVNYLAQLAVHGATVGVSPAQIAAITASIGNHRTAYTAAEAAKATAEGAVANMNTLRKVAVTDVRAMARAIKSNAGYTEQIGKDLRIIGDEDTTDLSTLAPTLKVRLVGGQPEVSFDKRTSDGVRIYSKVEGEADFSFLAIDTRSPYVDTRPVANPGRSEKREYYAFYMLNDAQVGLKSAVVSVAV